jgi:hypothetical protein
LFGRFAAPLAEAKQLPELTERMLDSGSHLKLRALDRLGERLDSALGLLGDLAALRSNVPFEAFAKLAVERRRCARPVGSSASRWALRPKRDSLPLLRSQR